MVRSSMTLIALSLACAGCASGTDGLGRSGEGTSSLALVSSAGELNILRRGESLSIRTERLADLRPETVYRAEVQTRDGEVLGASDVLTDLRGIVPIYTLVHDVGEHGEARAGDELRVKLFDPAGDIRAEASVVLESPPPLQVPGFNVTEVSPPHVFAADAAGQPTNAFAVGGAGPGEVGGPVYVAGDGFPEAVAGRQVDVYVAHDADEWRGRALPRTGDAAHVAGPVAVNVTADGHLARTAVFTPALRDVGIFDILVDVDRDGRFEWSFSSKDGADGLARVGFTVQYGAAWMAARTDSHIIVNIAYDSHHRDGGEWRNEFVEGEPVFMYLNPPVMHRYHFNVTKWIVRHQDFDAFWNNPAVADADGAVPFDRFSVRSLEISTQSDCTNSRPTCFGLVPSLAEGYDVVFDRDGDGRYMPGEDLLDVVSGDVGGELVPVSTVRSLPPERRVGFRVSSH